VNTTVWIIVAVVVIVLLAIIAIAFGLWRRSQNTISFSKEEEQAEPKEVTQQDRSGNYQAGAGFSFTTAEKAPAPTSRPKPKTEPVGGSGGVGRASTPPEGAQGGKDTAAKSAGSDSAADSGRPRGAGAPAAGGAVLAGGAAAAGAKAAGEEKGSKAPKGDEDSSAAETAEGDAAAKDTGAAPSVEKPGTEGGKPAAGAADEGPQEKAAAGEKGTSAVTPESAEAQQSTEPSGQAGESGETVIAPAPDAPTEEIAPAEGRMNRLRGRLSRSNNTVGKSLLGLLGAGDLDEEAWEEIEDTLIMADLGTDTTLRVVERLRSDIATNHVRTEAEVRALLRQALIDNLHPEFDRSVRALPAEGKPAVILIVGVNGTGKTTTTGKLARVLVASGRTILLGAADTFRAAAADQLQTWGERVGAETVRGKEAADPAAIAFDSVDRGIEAGVDAVLVDTAGRLHTKVGLMDQLGKVKRVVEKKAKVDEVLLVIDATTGQNGLQQARVFREVVDITGVVLTKLDGTAKGGIVFQVQHELGVPVKLVGLGEGADDLAPFVPEAFVDALLA